MPDSRFRVPSRAQTPSLDSPLPSSEPHPMGPCSHKPLLGFHCLSTLHQPLPFSEHRAVHIPTFSGFWDHPLCHPFAWRHVWLPVRVLRHLACAQKLQACALLAPAPTAFSSLAGSWASSLLFPLFCFLCFLQREPLAHRRTCGEGGLVSSARRPEARRG